MHPRTSRSSRRPLAGMLGDNFRSRDLSIVTRSDALPLHDVENPGRRFFSACKLFAGQEKLVRALRRLMRRWWSQTGSNRRPHACKARALPAELWPRNQKTNAHSMSVVGLGRLELPTSRLSSARSNQLSYKPELMTPPGADSKVPGLGRACPGRKRNEDGGDPA